MLRFRQVDRPQTRFHSCVCDDKMVLLLVLRSICLKYTADFDFRTTGSQSVSGSGQCLVLNMELGSHSSHSCWWEWCGCFMNLHLYLGCNSGNLPHSYIDEPVIFAPFNHLFLSILNKNSPNSTRIYDMHQISGSPPTLRLPNSPENAYPQNNLWSKWLHGLEVSVSCSSIYSLRLAMNECNAMEKNRF